MKIIQVCRKRCGNKPFDIEIKSTLVTFCCEKGFKESLKSFTKTVRKSKQTKH